MRGFGGGVGIAGATEQAQVLILSHPKILNFGM
jgi:hypothetical protein